jgi:hypothetical protein
MHTRRAGQVVTRPLNCGVRRRSTNGSLHVDDPEKLKLRDLVGHFTTKQLWGAIAALIGLVGTAFGLGIWLSAQKLSLDLATERTRFESEKVVHIQQIQAKDDIIRSAAAAAEVAAAESKGRSQALEQQLGEARKATEAMLKERSWLRLKAEFLEHFLRYELSRSSGPEEMERTKALFVGFVHRLWKTQEDKAVQVGMSIERDDGPIVSRPTVTRPTITKPTTSTRRVIKTVTFPDGSSYTVPYEVAAEVHRRG